MEKVILRGLDYIDCLIKPSLVEIGGLISDQLEFFRKKQKIRLIEKVQEIHQKRGVQPKPIELKTFAHILHEASLEESETISDMWANLLANATDSSRLSGNHHTYVSMLRDLSFDEASVLKDLFQTHRETLSRMSLSYVSVQNALSKPHFNREVDIDSALIKQKALIISDNFVRLGITRYRDSGMRRTLIDASGMFEVTNLGMSFLQECQSSEDSDS